MTDLYNRKSVIKRAKERNSWPLTFPERQMIAEQSLHPESKSYNISFELRLSGLLDEEVLQRSIEAFVKRHRVMRSYYPAEGGEVVHKISGDVSAALEKISCRTEELGFIKESVNRSFDLARAPLYRFFLIETGENEHILLLWVHHIVMDGTGFSRFLQDLRELYENRGEYPAHDSDQPDFPDYLDYAVWAAECDDSEESGKFFLDMFDGGVPENEMPTRPVRPSRLPAASSSVEREISVSCLKREAERRGKSLYSLLFSAFGLTLAKYCNSRDVTVGAAMSGRTHPQTAGMAGMFANILPVRIRIDPEESAGAYIERVSGVLGEVRANQTCPFGLLVPSLAPDRNESRHPVFDVIVNYLNEYPSFGMGGLSVQALPRTPQELRVDLNLEMIRRGGDLRVVLSFSPELYEEEVVIGMMDQFEVILERIAGAGNAEENVLGLSELPDAHRGRILEDFAGERDIAAACTVVDLFRERAREMPERRAVLFGERTLSYGELDAATDGLALRLNEMGAGRGGWVGILVRRSEMMPLCGMGVLKSGAGYVPLDPTYPPERLEFMLQDAGAETVIADPGLESLIPGFKGTILSTADVRNLKHADIPEKNPPAPVPGDPLVLLYTSGTTGQPKGVVLSHGNLSNFCAWLVKKYGMTSDDLVAAYASFGFDACLMDMYPTLTAGAAIYIIPEEMRLDLPRLNDCFNGKGVTVAFMTTQLGRQFAMDMPNTSLRILCVGGETLVPMEPPETFALYNAYGPTECTVLSTLFRVDRFYDRVPLGRPPSNTAVYIVDKSNRLAPVGVAGELCIAGRQVGLGYLNRPELTAEKFIKNPFSDDPEFSRVYRTGDIARFLPEGAVDFVGRGDFQVKIRGFRVELSEIELRIREHPKVKDATVVALDAPGGGKCAVAYVVPDAAESGGGKLDMAELSRFIGEKLPPYMVPAAVTQIDAIPLNPNGKVDRRKLPPPEFGAQEKDEEGGRDLPKNDLEIAIVEILNDILGHGQFGLNTDLLRAGLTSLSAIRLCVKLDSRFGVAPPVTEIMKTPTLLGIENAILRKLLASQAGGEIGKLSPAGAGDSGDGYPLSQNQAGICFECMKRPGSTVYNIPFRLSFSPAIDARRLAESVAIVIDAHPILKSHIAAVGGEMRQIPGDMSADVPCGDAGGDELEKIVRDFVRPFNLFEGPLCRARVCRTPEDVTLLADFHHVVFDGSSLDIFLRELGEVYKDGEFLEKNHPAREKISCFDWAVREKSGEGDPDWLSDKAWFDGQLADFEKASELPGDLAKDKEDGKKSGREKSGEVIRFVDRAAAENFTRTHGTTLAGLFLAGLAYAAGRWIGSPDVYIATISSGRSDPGLVNSFGMFVRTLPLALHTREEGVNSSLDFVRACQQKLTDVMIHERYPFTLISQEHDFQPAILYACQIGLMEEHRIGEEPMVVDFLAGSDPMFKMSVFAEERGGEFAYVVQYDASCYSLSLMERFAETLTAALEHIAANPLSPLRKVSLISDSARALLAGFNRTGGGSETTLVDMFRGAVRKNPDKTALVAVDGEYSYSSLDALSNKVANALLALGARKEDRVAFVLHRTSRVIASMFGILKAGCAYIPVDPDYPAERVAYILNDSDAKYLLTTPDTRAAGGDRAVDFDSLVGGAGGEDPGVPVSPDQLAYLLYTSGSTGKPKGVMIEHRGIANFIANDPRNDYAHALVRDDCRMLSITTVAFDMFGIETLLPLCNGLTTVLADDEAARDPIRMTELLERTGANAIDSTPTRILEYSEYPPLLEALRRCGVIILGGEKYPAALLARLRKDRKHDSGLFNIYGPTEISIACNSRDLSDLPDTDRITTGPPLLNVREAVVDADDNALPPGVVGELLIGGRGVGRGYINRPEQTEERFIMYEGERFYRSGDFARWTENGEIEILGRNDNQIKLRGLRIELGEVENALSSVEGVRSCAVMIRRIQNSDHLCAWYAADGTLEPMTVKKRLAETLTPYMVPTAYRQLGVMPKTPNGKNDLRALPDPDLLKSTDYEAPKTALEEAFCEIFARVLDLAPEKVGAKDSFFDIGGSSLAVTRVVVEAKRKGGTGPFPANAAISYSDVFAHPTPNELAALLAGGGSAATPPEQVHAEPSYDYGPINELLARGTMEAFRSGPHRPLGNVLLTGATGFLGIHMLRALLEDGGEGAIFCLLRGKRDTVISRLKNMFFYYFEEDLASSFEGKLHAAEGDITSPESLEALTRLPIDTIINCAANVTHFAKDTSIEDVNLGGVRNLIEFAVLKKARLVQISTGSVAGFSVENDPPTDTLMDESMLYFGQNLENQYVHSKFMAERAVLEAVLKGLDAKIMRLGNLMGRNRDGEFQINANANSFLGSLRAYQTIGCFPWPASVSRVELSPIDSTARAILLLAGAPPECVVFHPFSDRTFFMGDIVEAMKDEGLEIEMAEDEMFDRVLGDAMKDRTRAERLVSLIAYQNVAQGRPAVTLGAKNEYTSQALRRMSWTWPEAADGYLHKFLTGMISLGFFDAK